MSESEFTVHDAVEWLGLTWEQYVVSTEVLRGRHGNPLASAVLSVRYEYQRAARTPAEVLSEHGIDPADPMAAVRRFEAERARLHG